VSKPVFLPMKRTPEEDQALIERIRGGDSDAWTELIAGYEGRLLAFVDGRLSNRSASEDIVQETFVGFLNSLPNYDGQRSLESYLFSICAYKLTDHLRREGRRPSIPMSSTIEGDEQWQVVGNARQASSIARSGERKKIEEAAIVQALVEQVDKWQEKGDWVKLKCIELLIVRGRSNKRVAEILNITEQQVANFKFDFLARMRTLIKRQGLSQDVFPELYD
jgi:RNA polymerase sigma-70 factor (ECF subfamily)